MHVKLTDQAILLLALALACGSALAEDWQDFEIARCQVEAAAVVGPLPGSETGKWRTAQLGGIGEVQCSGPDFEPVDICLGGSEVCPLAAEPEIDLIELRPASQQRWRLADGQQPTALTVEWRQEAAARSHRLAKRRVMSTAASFSLPVACGEARILRIHRPGCSPHSFYFAGERRATELVLPSCQIGGEISGLLPREIFVPQSFRLASGELLQVDSSGWFAAAGLAPGEHSLLPIYRGGVAGSPIEVVVKTGETRELLPLPLPPVGALDLALDPALCAETLGMKRRVELVRLVLADEGRSESYEPLHRLPLPNGACHLWLEGLSVGSFDLRLTAIGNGQPTQLSKSFDVSVGEVTTLLLGDQPVVVAGRVVTVDDEPVPDVGLEFARHSSADRLRVRSDANGEFEARLPAAGNYSVLVLTTPYLPTHSLTRTFPPGHHQLTIEIPGGVIHLSVERADGAEFDSPVELRFDPLGSNDLFGGFLLPEEDKEIDLLGVTLGRYSISATSDQASTDDPTVIELSEKSPIAHVELLLTSRSYRLRLVDGQGRQVAGARVVITGRHQLELGSGIFDLAGTAPGRTLRINPPAGYLPVCRILTRQTNLTVELRATTAQAVIVLPAEARPTPRQIVGSLSGLPGSNCPVWVSAPPGGHYDERGLRLELALMPGVFVFRAFGKEHSLAVPGPPLILGGTVDAGENK